MIKERSILKKKLKYILLTIIPIFTVTTLLTTAAANPPDEIRNIFPDPVLADEVAMNLGVDVDAVVTDDDLLDVVVLNFDESQRITDFTGIERLVNLEELFLDYQGLTSLSPISSLENLVILNVEGNAITDLSYLAGMVYLEELMLGGNPIDHVDDLAGLSNLRVLSLFQTNLTSLSGFSGMTQLEVLDLTEIDVDVSEFVHLVGLVNLRNLNLSHIEMDDIGFVSGLVALERLVLVGNRYIRDLSPLSGLTDLVFLEVSWNQVDDLAALTPLTSLEELVLTVNEIEDVSSLNSLPNLQHVNLSGNRITDIRSLSGVNIPSMDMSYQWVQKEVARVGDDVTFVVYGLEGVALPLEVAFGNGAYADGAVIWHEAGFSELAWSLSEGSLVFSGSMSQNVWDRDVEIEDEETDVDDGDGTDDLEVDEGGATEETDSTEDLEGEGDGGSDDEGADSEGNQLPETGYDAMVSTFVISITLISVGFMLSYKKKASKL